MSFPRYLNYKDSGNAYFGDVPAHWELKRLGSVCSFQSGKAHEPFVDDDGEFICVNSRFVSTQGTSEKRCTRNLSPAQIDDVLMVMSDLPNGRALARAFYVSDDRPYAVNQRVCIIRALSVTPRFMFFLLDRNHVFLSHDDGFNQTHLSNDVFTKFPLLVPSPAEQIAIAAFLDAETAKIDELVAEQRRLIELLKEKRQAIISHAVTKGLNPNVPLRPSGNEWLGDVPEHWGIVALGRVCNQVGDGPHFSPKYVEADDGGVLFLSARNIKVDRWDFDDVKYVSTTDAEEFDRCIRPEVGDVLYTKGGTTGIARVVDLSMRFQVWVHVAVLKIKKEIAAPEYIALALNSTGSYEQSQLYTRGATNQDLGLTRMVKIRICLPPIGEQLAIVSRLDFETRQFNTLLLEAEHAIELLQERRTALISAAVTGKIDVRALATHVP